MKKSTILLMMCVGIFSNIFSELKPIGVLYPKQVYNQQQDQLLTRDAKKLKRVSRKKRDRFIAEVHSYLFMPTGRQIKKIYKNHWARQHMKALVNLSLTDRIWKHIYLFIGFDFLRKKGVATNSGDSVEMTMTPLLLGLRYVFPVRKWLKFTADFGLYYSLVSIRGRQRFLNDMQRQNGPFINECVSRRTPGGVVQGGVSLCPSSMFSLDFVLNYSFAQLDRFLKKCSNGIQEKDMKLSGLSIGGGVGFHF